MPVPFGKYLLLRKLAEGGMAEIFLARQAGIEGFERLVVVKRLLPDMSSEEDFVKMFLNEARLAARLNHPNIVQIYELGQADGAYFIAMEYILGEDLRGLAERADAISQRPSLGLICRIIIDILAGLHYAHTRTAPDGKPLGLVHRDISPQNILVTYDGGVKVIDFGIAKATQQRSAEQTQAGMLKGKYAYMSPEQTRGAQLDARSDIFSVGILLWELTTWRRLFKRGTDLATLVAVCEEPAPPMSLIHQEVPAEMDQIAQRALAIDPDARFSSAQEFQAALEECILNQGWEADTRALAGYMREIFKEKIEKHQEEIRSMQATQDSGAARATPKTSGPVRAVPSPAPVQVPRMTMPLRTIESGVQGRAQPAAHPQGQAAGRPPSGGEPRVMAPPPSPAFGNPRPPSGEARLPVEPLQAARVPSQPQPALAQGAYGPAPVALQPSPPNAVPTAAMEAVAEEAPAHERRLWTAVAAGLLVGVLAAILLQLIFEIV